MEEGSSLVFQFDEDLMTLILSIKPSAVEESSELSMDSSRISSMTVNMEVT